MDGAGTHFERSIRRKIASPDGGRSRVAWFFVLLLVGGISGTVFLLHSSDVDGSAPGSVKTSLTFGSEPAHVRSGFDPAAASREAPPTTDLAQTVPSALVAMAPAPTQEPVPGPTTAAALNQVVGATPAAGTHMRVAHTDGQGVVLRTAPRLDARVPRGLLDGVPVTVIELSGAEWVRVRDDNGRDGWVPAQYLATAAP
jgi:Bacterial SH3 domain